MIVHWHPDNIIFIRNDDGSEIFSLKKEKLEEILNITFENLPEGIIERQYFSNSHIADFNLNTQFTGPETWSDGDTILSSISTILSAIETDSQQPTQPE